MNFTGQGSDKPNEISILEFPLKSKQMEYSCHSTSSEEDEGSVEKHRSRGTFNTRRSITGSAPNHSGTKEDCKNFLIPVL